MQKPEKVFYGIEEYYKDLTTDDKKLIEISKANRVPSIPKKDREEKIKANMIIFVLDCIDGDIL